VTLMCCDSSSNGLTPVNTVRMVVDPTSPPLDLEIQLSSAADILRCGGLVAFPTETVYGLGANALDGQAVARVFVAKGRPQDNPLIVHIACLDDLQAVVAGVPDDALALARAFWPGPLTIVLPVRGGVAREVTAGGDTVAVRMPSHPVAMALIRAAGLPIAAPSANISGRPSPTRADHVWADLAGRIEMIVDGGPAGIGVESTVLDITSSPPLVLRPGGVPVEAIRNIMPDVCVLPQHGTGSAAEGGEQEGPARSPGLRHRHYAPRAPLWLFIGEWEDQVQAIACRARAEAEAGRVVGLLISTETAMTTSKASIPDTAVIAQTGSRGRMASVASGLFDAMRRLDSEGVDVMLAESYDTGGVGLAVMNRLVRSAGGRLVDMGRSGRK
jgi:L-threonylcarbamoyladenylate synthase